MNKLVIINLGSGDLYQGFSRITAQFRTDDRPILEQFVGSLPANPLLVELYRGWQGIYQGLCDRKTLRSPVALDDDLEIDQSGITNVSQISFEEQCHQLKIVLNDWLQSNGFLRIERPLRSLLSPTDDIRIIIETSDMWLWRLPWQQWDLLQDYPRADIALSSPEYRQRTSLQPLSRHRIRILAILGNTQGIDVRAETNFLQNLPNTNLTFLVSPTRREFNQKLWDRLGWDILFFAGHSQTEAETGRLYINEQPSNNSLTIEQLEEALKAAIEHGLKLAVFNSCDGLGLALALEKLCIPAVVVMREAVPNGVAQAFFDYFLEDFVEQHSPLYLSIRRARRKMQGLEDEFPGASWLPVICQNPAAETPSWGNLLASEPELPVEKRLLGRGWHRAIVRILTYIHDQLQRYQRSIKWAGLISLLVTLLVFSVRSLGLLEPLELISFDQMMRFRPFIHSEGMDDRLLIIDITNDDIEAQRRRGENLTRISTTENLNQEVSISLSDQSLHALLDRLERLQPRLIGLDIHRDFPVELNQPGLADQLKRMPIITICKAEDLRDPLVPVIDPPPEIPLERIGFNDVQTDDDDVLRRHLLRMSEPVWSKQHKCNVNESFSTRLAFSYLRQQNVAAQFIPHKGGDFDIQLGDRLIHTLQWFSGGNPLFRSLRLRNGGYQQEGWGGSQILLNYRASEQIARRYTLTKFLNNQVNADDYVRDKLVLIGVKNGNDLLNTPLAPEMPGVDVIAHMVSQILSAALDNRPLLGMWSGWIEGTWILGWSFVTGILTVLFSLRYSSLKRLLPRYGIAIALLIAALYSMCCLLLISGYWVPFIPVLFALFLTGTGVAIGTIANSRR